MRPSIASPAQPLPMIGPGLRGRVLCVALDAKGGRVGVPIAVDLAHGSGMDCTVIAAYAPSSSWAGPLLVSLGAAPLDPADLSHAEIKHMAGGRSSSLNHVWAESPDRALAVAAASAAEGNVECALVAYSGARHQKLAERIVARLEDYCDSVMPVAADTLPF
jgi:hypothetical protein